MRRFLLALPLLILGCATTPHPHPAQKAATPAQKPPCAIPSAPAYPDTPETLAKAPGLIGRDLLLKAGKDARDAYERRVAEAKRACH